jgi:signal transduction histidine kinase
MPFENLSSKSLVAYAVAIAMVLGVAVVAIRSLDAAAADRLDAMRTLEQKVTLAERLRWRSELNVAAGRGYIITGNAEFRQKLELASAAFGTLWRDLRRTEGDRRSGAMLDAAGQAAAQYERGQRRLHDAMQGTSTEDLAERFERELLPARKALGDAIDSYVERQRALLEGAYELADTQRDRARALAIGSVAIVALIAGALVWLASRALARLRGRERDALRRAQAALAARDEMLGIVAHDLRNPLAVISMRASILRETSSSEKVRRGAESIEKVAEQMERLIRSLLDVSIIEAGRFAVSPTRCEVGGLVRESLTMFEGAAEKKQIELVAAIEPGLDVRADRERVIQVLSNLLGNAIKFTPEGGRVQVAAGGDAGRVRFSVTDTGPGISPAHLDHVFDRYWKEDGATAKGTGLGLFIARSIVEAHGGQISAASTPGSGASFTFTLPADSPAATPSSASLARSRQPVQGSADLRA